MKTSLITLAVLLLLPLRAAERPKILFILTDDQSTFDFGICNPHSIVGVVCKPSHHMTITGRTLWHLPSGAGAGSCPPNPEEQPMIQ